MVTGLQIWTIYDHPADFPNYWVAKCFINGQPTQRYLFKQSLEDLRDIFQEMGLVCFLRDPSDDPVIVESWF